MTRNIFFIFQMLLQNNFEPIMLVAARTNWRFKIGISRGSSAVSRVQSYFRKFGNSARKAKANMELFIRSLFQFQVTHSNKFLHRYSLNVIEKIVDFNQLLWYLGLNQFDWLLILENYFFPNSLMIILTFAKYYLRENPSFLLKK